MLRKIIALTRAIENNPSFLLAPAVYGDRNGSFITAADCGVEGVACIDDSARALELACQIHVATGLPWAKQLTDGYLNFLLSMQLDDGLFANFIYDWTGTKNLSGLTSKPDASSWWQARAVSALAKVWNAYQDEKVGLALDKALSTIFDAPAASDVRSLHLFALTEMWNAPRGHDLARYVSRWSDEIATLRKNDVLLNNAGESYPQHFWGHIQEGVLARAGVLLERSDLVQIAENSANILYENPIKTAFPMDTVIAYDIASIVFNLDHLYKATKEDKFAKWADEARQWFYGRNTAHKPVYDTQTGLVSDGIDFGLLNPHSGAESNIIAGIALVDDILDMLRDKSSPHAVIDLSNVTLAG